MIRRRVARRHNPSLLFSRVSVTDALGAWPELVPVFARAAAIEALTRGGFLPGDEAAERALRAKTTTPLRTILKRCGTPACLDAEAALGKRAPDKALVRAAPHVLSALQGALFGAWDTEPDAQSLLRVLAHADRKVAVWTTAQVARTADWKSVV